MGQDDAAVPRVLQTGLAGRWSARKQENAEA